MCRFVDGGTTRPVCATLGDMSDCEAEWENGILSFSLSNLNF